LSKKMLVFRDIVNLFYLSLPLFEQSMVKKQFYAYSTVKYYEDYFNGNVLYKIESFTWRGSKMLLYNPFILKRENLLEKDALNQDFDTSLLDEARHLEETLGILKTKLIDVFHDILAQSSDHTLLDAIRFLRNHKYKQFVERIDRLQIDSN